MKAIIFDMDGVLIDSEPIHVAIELNFLKELGVTITEKEMSKFIGTSPSDMWKILIRDYKIEHPKKWMENQLKERKTDYFKSHSLLPIHGIKKLLIQLKDDGVPHRSNTMIVLNITKY